ncbi:hypothetical protein L6R50_17250 [Myxococcota bacterium]|nr:hypothetical protein [Myxococcota bacterium]
MEAAGIRAAGEGAGTVSARHVFPDRPDPEEAGAATFQEATRRFQARLVAEALEASGGNVSEAARRLDVARSHLNDLIRAFGLRRGGP